MTLNQIFSAPRFFNLFRAETSSGYRIPFIVASVVIVFLILIFTINASDHDNSKLHEIWYPIILLAGGFYFTSTSFDTLNRKEQRMNYLMTPASVFEKFSLKLLITSAGYVVGVTLLYWIFSEVMDMIAQSYFEFYFEKFSPFDAHYLFMIKLYLVIQSVFILGAVFFNRFSFFKTLFTLWLFGVGIGLLGLLFFRILFSELFDGFFDMKDNIRVMPSHNFRDFMEFTAWPLLQNTFWYVLAPVLWVVAYFKLKEREV